MDDQPDSTPRRRRRKRRRNPGELLRSAGFWIALWCAIIVALFLFVGVGIDFTSSTLDRVCQGRIADGTGSAGCQ
jgi:hypothetical protein